jgi:hypothetical protein
MAGARRNELFDGAQPSFVHPSVTLPPIRPQPPVFVRIGHGCLACAISALRLTPLYPRHQRILTYILVHGIPVKSKSAKVFFPFSGRRRQNAQRYCTEEYGLTKRLIPTAHGLRFCMRGV